MRTNNGLLQISLFVSEGVLAVFLEPQMFFYS